jgi:hypothetical protein
MRDQWLPGCQNEIILKLFRCFTVSFVIKMKKCNMKRLYPLLEVLSRMGESDRQIVVEFLNEAGCEGLTECVHNGLWSKALDADKRKAIKTNLKKDAEHYRCILKEGCSKKRHKKLVQVGGDGLGLILNSVLPLLKEHLGST